MFQSAIFHVDVNDRMKSASFRNYVIGIIRETIYIPGTYGFGVIKESPEDIGFYVPDDGVYKDTLVNFLKYVFAPCLISKDVTNCTLMKLGATKIKNTNTDKTKFNNFMVPIANKYPNTLNDLTFFNQSWIDYRMMNEKTHITHKWQLLFSSHVYKLYLFYELVERVQSLFPHVPLVELKMDLAADSPDDFNNDIIVIYTDGKGVCDSPTEGTLSTNDVIHLLQDIPLDFGYLRIPKILFRNGELSWITASNDMHEQQVQHLFVRYAGSDADFDPDQSSFDNILKIKSIYNAEIDSSYNLTIRNSYYGDYGSHLMRGGTKGLFIVALFVATVIVTVIITVIVRTSFSQSAHTFETFLFKNK